MVSVALHVCGRSHQDVHIWKHYPEPDTWLNPKTNPKNNHRQSLRRVKMWLGWRVFSNQSVTSVCCSHAGRKMSFLEWRLLKPRQPLQRGGSLTHIMDSPLLNVWCLCFHSRTATTHAPALPTHRGATWKDEKQKKTRESQSQMDAKMYSKGLSRTVHVFSWFKGQVHQI